MQLTLRSRILFYLLVVSLCGILLTSFSVLWGFEENFSHYLSEEREKQIGFVENEAIQEYEKTGNLISEQLAGLIHQQAMMENILYQIYDQEGRLIADTTRMHNMMKGMGKYSDSMLTKDQYQSIATNLEIDENVIGSMTVYYPDLYVDEDFSFIKSIKQNIYLGAIITIILAIFFSMLFSKRLSSGFNRLSKAVHDLQHHKWHSRVSVEELSQEMQPLAQSFNTLADSLSKEESLRKQFTADMAHELRTPLATLRSQIEAYQDGIWQPTPERLQKSHNELMRLVRLVNELEKLLQAENPQIRLQKTDIEAGQLIGFVESQFQPVFREKGVHLITEKSANEHWFKGDQDRIIQVLTNILNNALQYTEVGKNVMILTIEKEGFIGFSIKDEGIGIKQEDLPYLYERFYRGDKSRDRKSGGIGIGLSIVKALVDAHQGDIEIESELNVGTTVTVYFPMA